jgi:uncharacterized protein (DUF433 family)
LGGADPGWGDCPELAFPKNSGIGKTRDGPLKYRPTRAERRSNRPLAQAILTRYYVNVTHWQDHLSSNPQVSGGDVCIAGTRIPVTVVLDSLAEGSTKDEILRSYPSLQPEHIDAALAYAAELAHEERLVPIRAK